MVLYIPAIWLFFKHPVYKLHKLKYLISFFFFSRLKLLPIISAVYTVMTVTYLIRPKPKNLYPQTNDYWNNLITLYYIIYYVNVLLSLLLPIDYKRIDYKMYCYLYYYLTEWNDINPAMEYY